MLGVVRVGAGGGTVAHWQREGESEGSLFPPNPPFQGLLSADLHMKWYLIHSHSVESSKPATAEALAEGVLSHKAFNWHVIRLWNCVAPLEK